MTDTNELRRMLDDLADETPEMPAQEWLAGTRHKVRVRRQARWAGTTAATALVLAAAVAVVPQVMEDAEPEPAPADGSLPPDGQDGWPFAAEMNTERIIEARINDPDAVEFEWATATKWPSSTIYMQFCRLAAKPEPGQSRVRVALTINGRMSLGWGCVYREDFPPVRGPLVSQDLSRDLGSEYGVEANEPFTVAMWLERDGQRLEELPGVTFGFGIARCQNDGHTGGTPGCSSVDFPGGDPGVG